MILASGNILDHVSDMQWTGCRVEIFGHSVTLMSSGIASMIVVIVSLGLLLPYVIRKYSSGAQSGRLTRSGNALEVLVLFVRDQIAAPSLGAKAPAFLPLLLTLFVFIFGMNLIGLTPLHPITVWVSEFLSTQITGHRDVYPIGMSPTSILTVCLSLALMTLTCILACGLWKAARRSRLPLPAALVLSPLIWFKNLAPHVPGATGKILCIPLAILELVGLVAKCFSLMVRLAANMIAGHVMLAVLMMFAIESLQSFISTAMASYHFLYIAPI
ncbi:MAG TPA: F0F1 ATP synthase subunit A, partial [Phycisphaerae bacterium]|nr:F0F1 ATP synthase subunit A [Phycisphaerae bacterium]